MDMLILLSLVQVSHFVKYFESIHAYLLKDKQKDEFGGVVCLKKTYILYVILDHFMHKWVEFICLNAIWLNSCVFVEKVANETHLHGF